MNSMAPRIRFLSTIKARTSCRNDSEFSLFNDRCIYSTERRLPFTNFTPDQSCSAWGAVADAIELDQFYGTRPTTVWPLKSDLDHLSQANISFPVRVGINTDESALEVSRKIASSGVKSSQPGSENPGVVALELSGGDWH